MSVENEVRRRVYLLRVPVREFVRLQVYFDDMVRELQLIAVGTTGHGAAGRLADLAIYVQHDIAGHRNILHAEALAAERRGDSYVDMSLDLLPASLPDAHRLVEVTEALDAQSRSGEMLTAPAPESVVGLLRWIVRQVELQLGEGGQPERYQP